MNEDSKRNEVDEVKKAQELLLKKTQEYREEFQTKLRALLDEYGFTLQSVTNVVAVPKQNG